MSELYTKQEIELADKATTSAITAIMSSDQMMKWIGPKITDDTNHPDAWAKIADAAVAIGHAVVISRRGYWQPARKQ
jgi:hypothetical protein